MDKKRLLRYEAFVAVVLSFIGGIFDVYCLFNFNIYAMLHTGNIIKLVTNLIDGEYAMFLATLLIVLAFAVGIYLANAYQHHQSGKGNKSLLGISMLLLLSAAAVPNDTAPGVLSPLKLLSSALLGFEGAFLVHSFIRFGDYSFSATTMTADINRFVTGIYNRISTKDKKHNYGILGVITTKCGSVIVIDGQGGRLGDCRSGGIRWRSDCQHSENHRPSELPA